MRNSVTYQIVCKACGAHYKGETSRNMYTRGNEHLQQFKSRSKASAMWAHCIKHHDSRPVEFKMEQTASFSTSHRRQVAEGVQIRNYPGIPMNRKSEWKLPGVARAVYVRHVDND